MFIIYITHNYTYTYIDFNMGGGGKRFCFLKKLLQENVGKDMGKSVAEDLQTANCGLHNRGKASILF